MKQKYIKPEMEEIRVDFSPLLDLSDPDHAESKPHPDDWDEEEFDFYWPTPSASSYLQD